MKNAPCSTLNSNQLGGHPPIAGQGYNSDHPSRPYTHDPGSVELPGASCRHYPQPSTRGTFCTGPIDHESGMQWLSFGAPTDPQGAAFPASYHCSRSNRLPPKSTRARGRDDTTPGVHQAPSGVAAPYLKRAPSGNRCSGERRLHRAAVDLAFVRRYRRFRNGVGNNAQSSSLLWVFGLIHGGNSCVATTAGRRRDRGVDNPQTFGAGVLKPTRKESAEDPLIAGDDLDATLQGRCVPIPAVIEVAVIVRSRLFALDDVGLGQVGFVGDL